MDLEEDHDPDTDQQQGVKLSRLTLCVEAADQFSHQGWRVEWRRRCENDAQWFPVIGQPAALDAGR